jgi:Holliday junction resolvase RusA-like endonuclease
MTFLTIPCSPVAQPRQRHALVGGHVRNYTPTASPANTFKATARLTWQQFCKDVAPLDCPVYLGVDFVFPKPKSKTKAKDSGHRIWCDVKPDVDNLLKCLQDALNGLAWTDDKLIVMVRMTKTYAADCESPKVELTVLPAEPIVTTGGD